MEALPPTTYLWTQHRIYSCYKFLTLVILALVAASHTLWIHRFRHFSNVPDILLSLIPATTWDLQWFFITLIFTLTVTLSLFLFLRFLSMAGEYSETKLKYGCKFNPTIFEPSSVSYPRIFLSPILRLLWAAMVPKKSSPWSSGYTTHLGTSTNVPQCCDIIGGFAYFKLFEQDTGSYKYPQLCCPQECRLRLTLLIFAGPPYVISVRQSTISI